MIMETAGQPSYMQRDVLGGEGGQAQIVGHGIGAHGAAEHQQDGGEDGGLDHGQRDLEHGLPLGRVQDRGGLLKVGVHVAEDSTDKDVGKGSVVQAQHHKAGEQALAPPQRHLHAQRGGQQAVGRAGDGVGVEQVLPHHGQRPLGHDVGEDEDGAEVFAAGQVRARNETYRLALHTDLQTDLPDDHLHLHNKYHFRFS